MVDLQAVKVDDLEEGFGFGADCLPSGSSGNGFARGGASLDGAHGGAVGKEGDAIKKVLHSQYLFLVSGLSPLRCLYYTTLNSVCQAFFLNFFNFFSIQSPIHWTIYSLHKYTEPMYIYTSIYGISYSSTLTR